MRKRTDSILNFAGLTRFQDAKLKNLSSGMQVRLAFSIAIQTEADILLVDEALAVADAEPRIKLLNAPIGKLCFDPEHGFNPRFSATSL